MKKRKKSFFERITGSVKMDEFEDELDYYEEDDEYTNESGQPVSERSEIHNSLAEEATPETGQLSVDVINKPDYYFIRLVNNINR